MCTYLYIRHMKQCPSTTTGRVMKKRQHYPARMQAVSRVNQTATPTLALLPIPFALLQRCPFASLHFLLPLPSAYLALQCAAERGTCSNSRMFLRR